MLERVWGKGNALKLLVGIQTDTATMEDGMEIPKKIGIEPPYGPAIPLLGIYPEETKIERDTCILLFITALFTIARTQSNLCPSTDEWIKKYGTYT